MERPKPVSVIANKKARRASKYILRSIAVGSLLLFAKGEAQGVQEPAPHTSSAHQAPLRLLDTDINLLHAREELLAEKQTGRGDEDLRNLIPLLKEKQSQELTQVREKTKILKIIDLHPEAFSMQDKVDVEMYYPIYEAAGDKFKVDWYLLWIMHGEESTVSRDPNAFNGSNGYAGAMQRNPYFYPEEIVDEASRGLENLATLPQRHPTDWREISFAAWKISRDQKSAQEKGRSQPLLAALESYSRADHAYNRWEKYNSLRSIFS